MQSASSPPQPMFANSRDTKHFNASGCNFIDHSGADVPCRQFLFNKARCSTAESRAAFGRMLAVGQ
jgi:hypothetical protein